MMGFLCIAWLLQSSAMEGLTPQQEAQAQALGRILRCPVCQGMPIGESPAPMAQNMMRVVRQKISKGESPQTIQAYFVARYGEWIILDPAWDVVSAWIWLLPPLATLIALFVCHRYWQKHLSTSSLSLPAQPDTSVQRPLNASVQALLELEDEHHP